MSCPRRTARILVGSSRDPLQSYLLVGTACECQDFTRGNAPDGWCQHRIAAGIAKRVRELLPPEQGGIGVTDTAPAPQGVGTTDTPALPEAPASCNVYLTISGHKVQVTLRDGDEQRMLARLQTLLDKYPPPAPQAPSQPQGQGKEWCSKHQTTMHWNEGKEGRKGWHSHRTDDGWCKGR